MRNCKRFLDLVNKSFFDREFARGLFLICSFYLINPKYLDLKDKICIRVILQIGVIIMSIDLICILRCFLNDLAVAK